MPVSPEQISAVHLDCLAQLNAGRAPQFNVAKPATVIRIRLFNQTAALCRQHKFVKL